MAGSSSITVKILGDADGFRRATQDVDKQTGSLAGTLGKLGAAVGGAFAVTKVVGFAKGAIDAASDLNETVNKSNIIFGANAKTIDTWAKGAAKNLGLSRQSALEAASGLGDMFLQLGFAGEAATKMSMSTVQLSADLGSFNNLPTAEVQERISAALRGEFDSLQAIIPNINAARVEQEALAMTGKSAAKELTAQEKAAATLAIVHKDGSRAAGDFANTSDGLANKQKILSAQVEDVKARLGAVLLPIVLKVTSAFADNLGPAIEAVKGAFKFLGDHMDIVGPILAGLAVTIAIPLVGAFVAWAVSAGAAAAATLVAIAPVIAIAAAIAALVAGIVWAYQNVDWFREAIDKAANILKAVFATAIDAAKLVIGVFIDYVKMIARIVGDVVGGVTAIFRGDWKTAWDKFSDIPKAVIDFLRGALDKLLDFVGSLGGRIGKLTAGMWDGIKDAFRSALNWLIDRWNGLEFKVPGFKIGPVGYDGFTLGVPDIPKLATGGIVSKPTLAMIGEAGPEAVVPLNRAGGTSITINNLALPGVTDVRSFVRELQDYARQNGKTGLLAVL